MLLGSASAAVLAALLVSACSSSSDDPTTGATGDTPPVTTDLTYAKDVEPLVQEKCQNCHRPGGVAPFSLMTYEEVKAMGVAAKQKVVAHEMPPWGAFNDATCNVRLPFKDSLAMTDAQVDTFARWVEGGMPLGDPNARPPARTTFAATRLEGTTNTLAMAKPHEVLAGAKDDIRCFPIDPKLTKDTWIAATNVVPGDSRVVHHVIVYLDPQKQGAAKAGTEGSYPCFGGPQVDQTSLLLAWAPGVPPMTYGDGAALKIPKDAHLVMQVHYHPLATESVTEQSSFELRAVEERPNYVASVILAGNAESDQGIVKLLPSDADPPTGPAFTIPANAPAHKESMELVIPSSIGNGLPLPRLFLSQVGSHMHWAGVDMKIEIERANASGGQPAKECLLGTPKYDFNWQRTYTYDAPLTSLPTVEAGDKIRFTCTYDNTMNNRHVRKAMTDARMSSPPEIRLGEETMDEMCLGVLVVKREATAFD